MSVFITDSDLSFSGMFAESRKAPNSFVMSARKIVRLSMNQRGKIRDFYENLPNKYIFG